MEKENHNGKDRNPSKEFTCVIGREWTSKFPLRTFRGLCRGTPKEWRDEETRHVKSEKPEELELWDREIESLLRPETDLRGKDTLFDPSERNKKKRVLSNKTRRTASYRLLVTKYIKQDKNQRIPSYHSDQGLSDITNIHLQRTKQKDTGSSGKPALFSFVRIEVVHYFS